MDLCWCVIENSSSQARIGSCWNPLSGSCPNCARVGDGLLLGLHLSQVCKPNILIIATACLWLNNRIILPIWISVLLGQYNSVRLIYVEIFVSGFL